MKEKQMEILRNPIHPHLDVDPIEALADYPIDSGVTVADNLSANWIPVTQRLPESGEWVLCACRANIIEVLKYDRTMDDWDSTMPERCYMKGFVTHWMPLPEPPKAKEEKILTNADRIRAMTDEELAKHFSGLICDINEGVEYSDAPCCWFEWLKHPAR